MRVPPYPFPITGNSSVPAGKDVPNEKSRPHPSARISVAWWPVALVRTGCTGNFCNEIPQTPPTATKGRQGEARETVE